MKILESDKRRLALLTAAALVIGSWLVIGQGFEPIAEFMLFVISMNW